MTPAIRRLHFRADDLSAFAGSTSTDRYVKIIFRKPGVDYPDPLDVRALRGCCLQSRCPTCAPTRPCSPTSRRAPSRSTS
ncbi:siderophore-interacting protein [Agromyces sp. ISL-38]|uniref:siderophore-interacting protein n=1 Tax=Agromyces sp. ISL-38 TaxID=2819107 RepID=UPI0035ABFDBD